MTMTEAISDDIRKEWISGAAPGRSFAEVGGLWGVVNEQVTVAAAAGASELTMIDVAPEGGPDDLWQAFHSRLAEHEVSGVRCVRGSIDDPAVVESVGTFDVVHCSGVLYHCPEPLQTLRNLRSLVRETLVLGTATMPETVASSAGTVGVEPGAAMLVPAMTASQRAVLGEWLRENGASVAYGLNHEVGLDWTLGRDDWKPYEAWWWLFTRDYVAALLEVAGFEVRNLADYWNGRATLYLASPIGPMPGRS
jgi:SAM-dependent methyltransferase